MRGSIFDIPIIAIAVTVLAFSILIGANIMSAIHDNAPQLSETAEGANAMDKGVQAIGTFNYTFAFIFAALGLSSMIYAYLVPSHPIMIIAGVIMLLISVAFTPIMSNVYETFIGVPAMASTAGDFDLMTNIMLNLPLLLAIFGALLLIMMYSRWNGGSNQGTI